MKAFLLLLFSLTSCGTKAPPEPTAEEKEAALEKALKPRIIGLVSSVSPEKKFVLIQKYGPGNLPGNGTYQTLSTIGNGGSIRPSGERVRDFFAADWLSGEIKRGDTVLFRPNAPRRQAQPEAKEPGSSEPPSSET